MRVSVIVNSKAGAVNEAMIHEKIKEALFRCDLHFCSPRNFDELETFITQEIGKTDFIVICGGDGTVNRTLNCLVSLVSAAELPPVCLVRSGTANDLATQMRVSKKIDRAARNILEGSIARIDLIELTSETSERTVMTTNGGIGIPALIAGESNRFREFLKKAACDLSLVSPLRSLAGRSDQWVKKLGSGIYMLMAVEALRKWNPEDWEIEVRPGIGPTFSTKASSILINNQPSLGQTMIPAPYTSNNDGLINLLVTDAQTLPDQVKAVLSFRTGQVQELEMHRAFEVPELTLKALGKRSMTFFGDGEILFREVREISARCLPGHLRVVVGPKVGS